MFNAGVVNAGGFRFLTGQNARFFASRPAKVDSPKSVKYNFKTGINHKSEEQVPSLGPRLSK
jgi:hypothetical protein